MSRFINAVTTVQTGKRHYLPTIFNPLNVTMNIIEVDYAYEYKVGVKWEIIERCRAEDLGRLEKNVISALSQAVYGDCRELLFNLEMAILTEKRLEILAALDALKKEILD